MPKVKIGKKHQVTIPKEVFDELDLEEGEYVEVKAEEGKIVLITEETRPKDQAWFWREEWQKKERKADEDIRNGELEGPFNSADKAIQALKGEE